MTGNSPLPVSGAGFFVGQRGMIIASYAKDEKKGTAPNFPSAQPVFRRVWRCGGQVLSATCKSWLCPPTRPGWWSRGNSARFRQVFGAGFVTSMNPCENLAKPH